MTRKKEEKIKDDYLNGMHYKDIFEKYNIKLGDLQKIIRKYKLTRKKSDQLKGNQNAKNSKGGHPAPDNAVVTGEFERLYDDVLSEQEKNLYHNYKIDSDDLQMQEYISEYKLLKIREIRMLNRIKKLENTNNDMTLESIQKKNCAGVSETVTRAEATLDKIQRIEDGLTRVADAKRKCRENMIKLGFSKRELEIKEKQAENELW